MPRPTRYRIEKRLARPRQEAPPKAEAVMVDVSTLPKREELDPEMPFEHLFSQWPSIRPFLYLETDEATGKRYLCIRGSLPPEYIGVAQDILRKYKPRQRVTADVQELQEVIP